MLLSTRGWHSLDLPLDIQRVDCEALRTTSTSFALAPYHGRDNRYMYFVRYTQNENLQGSAALTSSQLSIQGPEMVVSKSRSSAQQISNHRQMSNHLQLSPTGAQPQGLTEASAMQGMLRQAMSRRYCHGLQSNAQHQQFTLGSHLSMRCGRRTYALLADCVWGKIDLSWMRQPYSAEFMALTLLSKEVARDYVWQPDQAVPEPERDLSAPLK